ncbi:transglycosylase SLT domain-containing protein [Saccharicrinis sp. FJH2]|uniref:transglycosylase SLT domain-containing protein n=1 Tax=Saccharicrinis sp. FJH65 TaxID=3344659 RepID=UPI0035F4E0E9
MRKLSYILLLAILVTISGCHDHTSKHKAQKNVKDTIDLPQILKRDTLVALTAFSSTSYFIYKGQAMGYEYELLKKFTEHLGVNLRMVVIRDMDSIFSYLNNNEVDLVAYALTVTNSRKKEAAFTVPLQYTEQVLVQRLPDNWRNMTRDNIDKQLVTNVVDLIGKDVYVKRGSPYYSRLVNLMSELGDTINIHVVNQDFTTEELISKVAEGEIPYTVADKTIADLANSGYDNLDTRLKISFPQRLAWATRKSSPKLIAELNSWLESIKNTSYYNILYNKYYKNRSRYKQMASSDFFSHSGTSISPYDDLFKKAAKELHWDWRLLAAQVYQESRFDPWAESWMGAVGLMQIMPETAGMYGDYDLWEPDQNIEAGVQHLKWLYTIFDNDIDSMDHIKFTLASYNVGPGHVGDARKLAAKYGKDPNKWDDNVSEMIILKSEKKYYTDPVVEHGYCRGIETFNYVKSIMERYEHYKQFFEK